MAQTVVVGMCILSVVHHRAVSHERTNKRVYIVAYSLYTIHSRRVCISPQTILSSLFPIFWAFHIER
jgi:hypothetical protein